MYCRFGKVPIEGGMVPVKELCSKVIRVKLTKLLISHGKLPWKKLLFITNNESCLEWLPMEDGSLPVSWFSATENI